MRRLWAKSGRAGRSRCGAAKDEGRRRSATARPSCGLPSRRCVAFCLPARYPPRSADQRHAPRGGELTREGFDLHDDVWGENPGTTRPGSLFQRRPSFVKNRFRQRLTTSRPMPKDAPISSLDRPSAASRIILARKTSKYGSVYFRARLSRISLSSSERFDLKGAGSWHADRPP